MTKILMLVPLWKRPEIVKLFIERMRLTMPDYFELIPFFVLSQEDQYYKILRRLVSGYHVFEYKNNPLGEKKNAGLNEALALEWDYFMDMNSDSVWTPYLWELYRDLVKDLNPYFGIKNLHMIDLLTNRGLFLDKYHIDCTKSEDTPTAIGPGRCIHRAVVEKCLPLWRDSFNHGMDGSSHWQIVNNGFECLVIDNGNTATMLDVKTATNLNLFMEMEGEPVEVRKIYEWFGLNQFNIYNSNFTELVTFDGFRDEVVNVRNYYDNQEQAFEAINTTYEIGFGKKRYKNYRVYLTLQTRNAKR